MEYYKIKQLEREIEKQNKREHKCGKVDGKLEVYNEICDTLNLCEGLSVSDSLVVLLNKLEQINLEILIEKYDVLLDSCDSILGR